MDPLRASIGTRMGRRIAATLALGRPFGAEYALLLVLVLTAQGHQAVQYVQALE